MRRRTKGNNKDDTNDQEFISDKPERSKGDEEHDDDDDGEMDLKVCFVTSLIILFIYTMTLHPSVPGGDSGELIVSAFELGVAHPPGYPLFTILSKLFMTVIPFRNPAWRVNFLNAILSSTASGLIQLTVLRLTRCFGSSLLIVGLFSLNKLTWNWSVTAEVFGMNNVFAALLMLIAVDIDMKSNQSKVLIKRFYQLAFLSGLSLCNQHTIVVYVVCIGLWAVVKVWKSKELTISVLLKSIFCGLCGLSPYLYLLLSSHLNVARWTWGDQRTLTGFLTHVSRSEYGTFDLGKDQEGLGLSEMLSAYCKHLQGRMCELCPWLALIGIVCVISWFAMRRCSCTLVFTLMCTIYMVLFSWRANLDISNPLFKGVVERFWLQTDIGVALLAAIGYHTAVRMVTEKFLGMAKISMATIFTTMGACILIVLQLKNYSTNNQSSNFVVRNFAKTILDQMPPNAIILTKGDLPSNSLRYLHLCENVRRDLQIIDIEVLTYGWSLPMVRKFYPRMTFPGDVWQLNDGFHADGRKAFNFKTFLDSNYKKFPMFACIGMQERDPSWQNFYQLWPFGVCMKIESHDSVLDPRRWGNQTGGFSDKWTYPYDGFEQTSWEKVANDDMWHAKIGTPFFFYKQAEQTNDMTFKADLLYHSYEFYFRAIKLNQKASKMSHVESFPSFWHKNFALVCERLLHVDPPGGLDKIRLCKLSIYHFQQYVHLTPNDVDNDNINSAISIIKQRLDTFEKLDRVDETLENSAKRVEKLEELHQSMTNRQQQTSRIKKRQ